jgi:PIN domain nuclease of toxin-antitoxin system
MRLLLDTHAFIWWRADPRQLDRRAERAIARADLVFVSAASAWEAALKSSVGRLRFPGSFEEAVEDSDFAKLEVTFAHVEGLRDLPRHHTDPFDRMLIAQSRLEGLTVVTRDPQIALYGVPILQA